MREIKDITKNKKDLKMDVLRYFDEAMEDNKFASLCSKLKMDKKELAKYTTKLQKTVCDIKGCEGCKGLHCCNKDYPGYIEYPSNKDGELVFIYTPCKYKKKEESSKSKVVYYEMNESLKTARLKEILVDDQNRVEALKYIKKFMKEYPKVKGMYLYGSFGSGKSYMINAVLNELSLKGEKCISVYVPSLLRKLKDSFDNKDYTYRQVFTDLETADVLLLDDIGAENNTDWSRDEVLSSLLQSRMDNKKITFFTSNLDIDSLDEHLSKTKSGVDKLKSRRIIERVLELSTPISLISDDRRNSKEPLQ